MLRGKSPTIPDQLPEKVPCSISVSVSRQEVDSLNKVVIEISISNTWQSTNKPGSGVARWTTRFTSIYAMKETSVVDNEERNSYLEDTAFYLTCM